MAPPRKVKHVRNDYEDTLGADALERQQAEARIRLDCCAELKTVGHHPMCRFYVEPAVPEIHPGQASLL